jgi:hypothetical protein
MLSIILGILLVIAIALYVKKTMDENDEDIIQNSTIETDEKIIKAQKLLLLDASNQIDDLNGKLTDAINNVGIVSYGKRGKQLMVRFLNPKSLITLLMITDKLNVDKANNQTYTDKLTIINDFSKEITFENIFPEIAATASAADKTGLQTAVNKLKDKYTTQITTNFDTMNNNNRKIAANLLSIDLSKYAVLGSINFTNSGAVDTDNNGMNISDFINWDVAGKAGTDISLSNDIVIADKLNGDIINPFTMVKGGNLLDLYKQGKASTKLSQDDKEKLLTLEKVLKDLALM